MKLRYKYYLKYPSAVLVPKRLTVFKVFVTILLYSLAELARPTAFLCKKYLISNSYIIFASYRYNVGQTGGNCY